jgi:hypothetical protein
MREGVGSMSQVAQLIERWPLDQCPRFEPSAKHPGAFLEATVGISSVWDY